MPVMCDEYMKLIDAPTEEELVRARAQLKASLMMALESCFAQSEELARQLLIFDRRIPPEEIIAKIDAVDQDSDPPGRAAPADRRRADARRDRAARPAALARYGPRRGSREPAGFATAPAAGSARPGRSRASTRPVVANTLSRPKKLSSSANSAEGSSSERSM